MTKSGILKKKDFVLSFILNYLQNPFVPREGLEPSRRCRQQILSLPCLPFHHQGIAFFSRKAGAKILTFSDVAKKSFANRIKRCIFALEIKD